MTEMVPPSAPVPPNKKDVTGLEFLEGISVRRVSVLSFLTFLLFLLLLFPIVKILPVDKNTNATNSSKFPSLR